MGDDLVKSSYELRELYRTVTSSHVSASSDALTSLASHISAGTSPDDGDCQHVRLGLYEHGAFLNPILHGFVLYFATGEAEPQRKIPLLDALPPAHSLFIPTATNQERPLTYAIVANNPVEIQIKHTLATLARLIARRTLTARILNDGVVENLPQLAEESDLKSDNQIADTMRSEGWIGAAQLVAARAEASGMPLHVSFATSLMTREQIANQAPILRRVYNDSPVIRESIDKVSILLSRGMTVSGGPTQRAVSFVRDYVDIGLIQNYLAHLARDAHVCGNGYLSFGAIPDQGVRLLLPEKVTIDNNAFYFEDRNQRTDIHANVCHIRGADQQQSAYGLSVLEPFVGLQLEREQWATRVATAAAWDTPEVPRREREYAAMMGQLGEAFLASYDHRCRHILGAPAAMDIEIPPDLYFSGHRDMKPAAEAISIRLEESDDAKASVSK
ncbi:hypothetical protein [Mycobacterium marinum]|uniref:hypothetical protein n=1 Tax=Mycobacterium marinum TaxID=1781 RepID=UPI00235948DE|nr:hypothetical protein [Mycobacterium marinum]MDC8973171.1 hypothetical protein [Mycobacterium marinum]